jgi:hypothetical protein
MEKAEWWNWALLVSYLLTVAVVLVVIFGSGM